MELVNLKMEYFKITIFAQYFESWTSVNMDSYQCNTCAYTNFTFTKKFLFILEDEKDPHFGAQ